MVKLVSEAPARLIHRAFAILLVTIPCAALADHPWSVPGANLRIRAEVTRHPTHPDAGVILIIPDGGILPTPHAVPTIVSSQGKHLRHAGLWHNPQHGLSLVMEDADDDLWIYMKSSDHPYPRPPLEQKAFTASLLFYYTKGSASLEKARQLAFQAPVGTDILFAHTDQIYDTDPPAGRNGDGSSFYTGWFPTVKDGACYFYSISKEGSVFYIDGDKIHSWSGVTGQRGGEAGDHGAWRQIRAGLHHIDYFHFNIDHRAIDHLDPGGREAHFGMRTPDPQVNADAPPPGVPRDARPLRRRDYVRSGTARVTKIESRHGRVAAFEPRWIAYAAPGTNTLCHYVFEPIAAGTHPPGTTYTWVFEDDVSVHGRHLNWVFCDRTDRRVTLRVVSGSHTSTATRIFFPKRVPATRHSIATPEGRSAMRSAVTSMLAAADRDSPARASSLMSREFTDSIFSLLDVGHDRQLLETVIDVLNQRRDTSSWGQVRRIRELFIETLRIDEPEKISGWIEKFCGASQNESKRLEWMIAAAGVHIADNTALPDIESLLSSLESAGELDAEARLQLELRRGDLAYLTRDPDAARLHYREAAAIADTIYHDGLAWNGRRLKEEALVSQIHHALERGFTSETYLGLRDWERQFPRAKVEGKWWHHYARYALATQRPELARRILAADQNHLLDSSEMKRLLDELER